MVLNQIQNPVGFEVTYRLSLVISNSASINNNSEGFIFSNTGAGLNSRPGNEAIQQQGTNSFHLGDYTIYHLYEPADFWYLHF
ncbi:MAG: hypothetical protein KG003_07895 [Bacteroidetes bacterium]|nr:hypothetical protein [Bacteroidota bacterium]